MRWVHPLRGRTVREALADALTEIDGTRVFPNELERLPPVVVCYDGVVSWVGPYRGAKHYHSWDAMRDCLKYGFDVGDDLCVIARGRDIFHERDKR